MAQTVPQVIYTIPPSSPVYNVTYVTQVPASDGSVTASYTAGYMGAFIMGATVGAIVASGTGYYYPPYVYGGYYYPYAATYGYHTYNPYTGAYGYGGAAYGPYGSAHWGTSYNPNTGTYARGATASTAYGSRAVGQAYNPYTGAYGATRQGSNAYGSWGQSVYSKNGQDRLHAACQQRVWFGGNRADLAAAARPPPAARPTATLRSGKTSSGDMYAGHDGNVYKNTGSGWQKYDNGSWNNVQKPTTSSAQSYNQQHPTSTNPNYSADQQKAQSYNQQRPSGTSGYSKPSGGSSYGDLNQEAQDRQRGAEQSQRFSQYQHSGGWGGGGGDRWGGGGGDRWGGGGGRSGGGRR